MYYTRFAGIVLVVLLAAQTAYAQATSIWVANASFELPVYADGQFGSPFLNQQGGYGWSFSNSGIYNPPANTYSAAGDNGTPNGAHGIQVGYSLLGVSNATLQRLIGPDDILGNSDDPILTASSVYSLTISIGARLPGNQYGIDPFGGYTFQLLAGSTVIAQETNAFTPAPGSFADRTITVDTDTLNSSLLGQPLVISFASTFSNAVTDFDNVRLTVTTAVPEPVTILWISSAIGVVGGIGFHHRYGRKRNSRSRRTPLIQWRRKQ